MGPCEAIAFFDRFASPGDSFYLKLPEYLPDFRKDEQAIRVEVTGAAFRATSEASRVEAKAIIETLGRNEEFDSRIPATNREWDAYSIPEEERPIGRVAI